MTSESQIFDPQEVFRSLLSLLSEIGSANDAEDHGYLQDAEQIRADTLERIEKIFADHPVVVELFPELTTQIRTQNFLGHGWYFCYQEVEKQLLKENK